MFSDGLNAHMISMLERLINPPPIAFGTIGEVYQGKNVAPYCRFGANVLHHAGHLFWITDRNERLIQDNKDGYTIDLAQEVGYTNMR